ncbi:SNF2-related protein [Corynebacterium callunae]|uniref:SNF2-related protein n=1 Tax=Corynebacterium callunae TaxID=1721 RepID=UPI003982726D
MDTASISNLLGRAQQAVNNAQLATQLHRILQMQGQIRVINPSIIGDDTSKLHIFTPNQVSWPDNFYINLFLEGLGAPEKLSSYTAAAAVIPGLQQQVRDGHGGFLKRLFNPAAIRAGEQAAFDLKAKLDEIDAQGREVARLLEGAQLARDRQKQGVQLFPGVHGLGERYLETARAAVAQSLGISTGPAIGEALFIQWDAQTLAQARRVVQRYAQDPNSEFRLYADAQRCLAELNRLRVRILMEQLPIEALRTATDYRLRFGSLDSIHVSTVADVLRANISLLTTVSGIGEQTAQRMKAAAQTLETEALNRQTSFIGTEPSAPALELIKILAEFGQAETLSSEERARRVRVIDYVQAITPSVQPYVVVGAGADNGARIWEQLNSDLDWVNANPNLFYPQSIIEPAPDVWQDYLVRPAHYQALLSTLLGRDIDVEDELLDADTLKRIRELKLDTTHIKELHLRGYQSYGARFAIVREKVMIGDDMGLGKTVQAISVAAHLVATNKDFGVLVVVPASVIVNWVRECRRFTNLPVFVAHGDGKAETLGAWQKSNGILVCTYDGARSMDIPAPGLIIADEAHLIKNPETKRSKAVAQLVEAADYALLMTGTPLENRVGEFINLIKYIQPDLIVTGMESMGAEDFRRRIAPAYLRRNQADVLDELPEKTDSIEWIELTPADRAAYDAEVAAGNWMGMRRVAMLSPEGQEVSAKMARIQELLEEAEEHGRKALIFTFFLDVLDELEKHLGARVVGRISGEVPAIKRQELVDELSQAPAGSALIAQITAGGVGLNIQAASLCIICEPQVKPTIEQQAVARVHRMGQTATVQVHRLIGDETADERMLEILAGKREIFDVYARLSESAEVPDAVDITESQLAASIIDAERARLGIT